jgi:hypothetical protein
MALLFATIVTAHAATPGAARGQIKAQKHPHGAAIHHAAPHRTKPASGYDQNHGAYDPWYWDPSYGQ